MNNLPVAADTSTTAMHPPKDKMPNLDGVRAFACLFVIMAHLPLPWGLSLVGYMGYPVRSQIWHSALLTNCAYLLGCCTGLYNPDKN